MRPFEKSACGRSPEAEIARSEAVYLLGDFSAFLQQVGVGAIPPGCDSPVSLSSGLITDLPALQKFLDTYLAQILLPLELPAIASACGHARRGELRELIALDLQMADEPRLAAFAAASQKTGTIQLQRLQPLRGERTVQRYLGAVEKGKAAGWHTLVYGLTLAVYSFPLRQGLLHYAHETLSALARAAAGGEMFFDPACQEMLVTLLARVPEAVERTIPACDIFTVPPRKCS
jgi:urease accessory protein UreF